VLFRSYKSPTFDGVQGALMMCSKKILKIGLVSLLLLNVLACSKSPGSIGSSSDAEGLSSQGLGSLSAQFKGQEEGESYTTRAPHNQVYLFNYDDSSIKQKYLQSIHAQAIYLKAHPGAKILLAGHTDERGSREYNIALGERRANSVADLIRMDGVGRDQIRVVSYGKERPVKFEQNAEARRQNRRVELIYEATR
tara:strand:+ start:1824 stop:2408 length:585 start_codon:yes stop_codon:yes gene_type:complete